MNISSLLADRARANEWSDRQPNTVPATYEMLKAGCLDLAEWISPLIGYRDKFVKLDMMVGSNRGWLVSWYTPKTRFRIICRWSVADHDGYMAGYASARCNRVGESYQRGNDLPDGRFSLETFNNIIMAAAAYDAVTVPNDIYNNWRGDSSIFNDLSLVDDSIKISLEIKGMIEADHDYKAIEGNRPHLSIFRKDKYGRVFVGEIIVCCEDGLIHYLKPDALEKEYTFSMPLADPSCFDNILSAMKSCAEELANKEWR